MKHITVEMLRKLNACEDQVELFEELCDACCVDAEFMRKHILEEQDA